jgi:hypothetical protein
LPPSLFTLTHTHTPETLTPLIRPVIFRTHSMDFSMMEVKPMPLGVMQTAKSSSTSLDTSSLVVSGVLGGFSGLTVGATYYTTTSGELITPGTIGASNPMLNDYLYFTDKISKTIVSADSVIGVAVTPESILLRMK